MFYLKETVLSYNNWLLAVMLTSGTATHGGKSTEKLNAKHQRMHTSHGLCLSNIAYSKLATA